MQSVGVFSSLFDLNNKYKSSAEKKNDKSKIVIPSIADLQTQ